VAAGLSYYNPLTLLDLQPGDELGYHQEPIVFNSFACYDGWMLRRVLSRQFTADSLVYTFQQQSRTTYNNAPGCYGGGVVTTPLEIVRMAASRKSGRWVGQGLYGGLMLPVGADLLTYEYRLQPGTQGTVMMGSPVVAARPGSTCGGPALLRQELLYRGSGVSYTYNPGLDALGWQQLVSLGVGDVMQYEHHLTYFRRIVNGVDQTCGIRSNFGTLLPAHPAQHVPGFQAFPNPTTEMLQVQLEAPAQPGSSVVVRDALGRQIWHAAVAVGQTTVPVSLRGKPAGVYLVQLQTTNGAVRSVRIQKLP
jgi:hypothetical protein